jgi:peptidoglycan-associated lipoprotein
MVLLWAATGLALGACSYSQPSMHKAPVREAKPAPVYQGPEVVVTREPRAAPPPPVAVEPAPPPAPAPVAAPAAAPPPPQPPGVIYFEPDVYRIAPQYRPMLEEHARRLKADPALRLRVEAHADPEGGADYNRALTEKRAETVVKALRALGVDPRQLEARAHGAGRAEPSDPSDWARSRRVELVVQ